ncbi:MAG: hypothetical protein E7365_03275 [Clostridiales bacterium]|nr:hypothetical protein [Clostridiales bacterium]
MKKLFSAKIFLPTLLVAILSVILNVILISACILIPKLLYQPSPFDTKDFNKAFAEKIIIPESFYSVKDETFTYQRGFFSAEYRILIGIDNNPDTSGYNTLSDGNYIDATRPYVSDTRAILFLKVPLYQYEIHYLQGNFQASIYILSATSPNLNGHKHFLKELAKNINNMVQEN